MAIHDSLTGIYNRRHLNLLFNEDLNQCIMNNQSLSVALFDIDKFKVVNDTYGHIFGDEVIREVAQLGNEIAKQYQGYAARYGGEEFVILFPNHTLSETIEYMKEFQKRMRNMDFYHEETKVKIRVSIGITSYPEPSSINLPKKVSAGSTTLGLISAVLRFNKFNSLFTSVSALKVL